jgi:5-enolpyruvylshikimate-3-phosphate synthase
MIREGNGGMGKDPGSRTALAARTGRSEALDVVGGAVIRGGGAIESHGDHRIAMAGAMLALRATAPVTIRDTACVATSYPGFTEGLRALRPMG